MEFRKYLTLFNVVIVIGLLISGFLVYEHFAESASEFCNIGEGFDCGIVNKSPYANIDGIFFLLVIEKGWSIPYINVSSINVFFDLLTSVAFLGFWTLVLLLSLSISNKKDDLLWITANKKEAWIKGITAFGLLFGAYLFLIQHLVLKTYCIFCLGLDAVLISLVIIAWGGFRK